MNKIYKVQINPEEKIYSNFIKIISVAFIFNRDNQVLMQLRDNNPNIPCAGMWGPVGGNCEIGESPQNCCEREVYEETGYKVSKINFYNNYIIPKDKKLNFEKHIVSIFWMNYDNEQIIHCYEGQQIDFVDLNFLHNKNTLDFNILWISNLLKIKLKNE